MCKRALLLAIAVCFFLTGCAPKATQRAEQSSSVPVSSAVSSKSATSSSSTSSETVISSAISKSITPSISSASISPEQLKAILAKSTSQQIVFFQNFSTEDGQNGAFAIAGGIVWYVTSSGAQKLKSGVYFQNGQSNDIPVLWTVDGVKIFKCEKDGGGSSTVSYAWYVKNGKPLELPYTGMDLTYNSNGRFTTTGDAFDANFIGGTGSGHTYKSYYLYWSASGLKEYGGLKITQQQLSKAKGAQAIIRAITGSGHTIDDIYYRANNIININYHSGDKQNGNFDNVTLTNKNGTVTPVRVNANSNGSSNTSLNENNLNRFSYGGIYQAALFSKIATYPAQFLIG